MTIWSEPNCPRNVLADHQVVLFGGCVNGFDLQVPPQKVDGVEFDVHVLRATGVADIRRCEIRIELCLYCIIIVSKSTSFVLSLFQCAVFKVLDHAENDTVDIACNTCHIEDLTYLFGER